MCLLTQSNIKPCVAQKDIKVVKLLKPIENQEGIKWFFDLFKKIKKDNNYITPFQNVSVTLNNTLYAEGGAIVEICGSNGSRRKITTGYIHAKIKTELLDMINGIIGVIAYIPKGAEYYINFDISEVCAEKLFITDEIVDFNTLSLTKDEFMDVVEPFIDELIPTDKITPGWLFTTEKQFVHPLNYKEGTNIIGVIAAIDDNNKLSTVFALSEAILNWDTAVKYCKEYETKGTKEGDWALPDKDILQMVFEKNIIAINSALSVASGKLFCSECIYWASEEGDRTSGWSCYTNDADLFAYYCKCNDYYARPSLVVAV